MIIKLTSFYDEELYINTHYIVYWRECRFTGTNVIGSRILLTSGDMMDVKHSPEEISSVIPREG